MTSAVQGYHIKTLAAPFVLESLKESLRYRQSRDRSESNRDKFFDACNSLVAKKSGLRDPSLKYSVKVYRHTVRLDYFQWHLIFVIYVFIGDSCLTEVFFPMRGC